MGIDSGPSRHEQPADRLYLLYSDGDIERMLEDDAERQALRQDEPLVYLVGNIAYETDRGASEITNQEIADRFLRYGYLRWSKQVKTAAIEYLEANGHKVTVELPAGDERIFSYYLFLSESAMYN
jgi:hypothetical protein